MRYTRKIEKVRTKFVVPQSYKLVNLVALFNAHTVLLREVRAVNLPLCSIADHLTPLSSCLIPLFGDSTNGNHIKLYFMLINQLTSKQYYRKEFTASAFSHKY